MWRFFISGGKTCGVVHFSWYPVGDELFLEMTLLHIVDKVFLEFESSYVYQTTDVFLKVDYVRTL